MIAARAPAQAESGCQVFDFTLRLVEAALSRRARYRYVRPRVVREEAGIRIESPCCSRNVDPAGGVVDIALLTREADGAWGLYARDHAAALWTKHCVSPDLGSLLDVLCVDADRIFWR